MRTRREQKKYTRSTFYILPMLLHPLSIYSNHFINCYTKDENNPTLTNHIFILFDASFVTDYPDSYKCLFSHGQYVDDYCLGDYHMMVFSVPEQFEKDYKIFHTSKYSRFSEEYKKEIKRIWPSPITGEYSLTISALYPDDEKSLAHRKTLEKKIYVDDSEFLPEGSELISAIDPENEKFKLVDYYEMIV